MYHNDCSFTITNKYRYYQYQFKTYFKFVALTGLLLSANIPGTGNTDVLCCRGVVAPAHYI